MISENKYFMPISRKKSRNANSGTQIFIQKTFKGQNSIYIKVNFLFAKAREKVIFAPFIWISHFFWRWWEQIHFGFLNFLVDIKNNYSLRRMRLNQLQSFLFSLVFTYLFDNGIFQQ